MGLRRESDSICDKTEKPFHVLVEAMKVLGYVAEEQMEGEEG